MKKILLIAIIAISIDIILSNLILKKTRYWENVAWEKKWWRVPSKVYHHDILPNTDQFEIWGGKIKQRLITNSIGFRDKEKRIINKVNPEKKRILLIGDSFIEGSGLNYKDTLAGQLESELGIKFEILNSAVGSYSPSIYYKKIKYYIDEGFKFDQALVFLDVSDIYDEMFIKFDDEGNILTYEETKNRSLPKKIFYSVGRFLRDNSTIFRFLNILSDRTELTKNYIKLKIEASKDLNTGFFETKRDDVMFYRMTHIDRGFWTFDEDKFNEVKIGLLQSEKYLIKLFDLLKENKIESTLIVYPWPTQIFYGDEYHEIYWENFSKKYKINFLSVYDKFKNENKRDFIFNNFIYGDIHWNLNGTSLVKDKVLDSLKF